VGFEPTVVLPTHAFQACALNHSAISPTISSANECEHQSPVNAYFSRIRARGKLIRRHPAHHSTPGKALQPDAGSFGGS
jgi:hypothetical protein